MSQSDALSPEQNRQSWDHGLRRQAIVASVLGDVFAGRLRAGQRLVTQELARRFGVSHTPVREALIALAGVGVIDLLPNRGALVREVSARDVEEVCEVRLLLECRAVKLACGRIDPAQLETLAADLRRQHAELEAAGDSDRAHFITDACAIDSRLHDSISAACGNSFLAKELSRLKILFRAFRDVAAAWSEASRDLSWLIDESQQHLAIVESLLAGDARGAARSMERHLEAGVARWSRIFVEHASATNSTVTNGADATLRPPSRLRRPVSR